MSQRRGRYLKEPATRVTAYLATRQLEQAKLLDINVSQVLQSALEDAIVLRVNALATAAEQGECAQQKLDQLRQLEATAAALPSGRAIE